jgi:hypothetical protein
VAVHRSRYELERVLGRYGATDLAFVEVDANASLQFAMNGRYVQLALPLPDPSAARFTHTPSGRHRTIVAQERAYEQALREHWRALLLAVRGKLQSVESGISSFEDEFAGFFVPHFHEEKNGRRKKPKAVNWLLGSSHSLAIGLVAAFLLPTSAVGAFALPPSVVDHLSAPFRGGLTDNSSRAGDAGRSLALGASDWAPVGSGEVVVVADGDASSPSEDSESSQPGSADVTSEAPTPAVEESGDDSSSAGVANEPASAPSQAAGPASGGGQPSDGASGGAPPGKSAGGSEGGSPAPAAPLLPDGGTPSRPGDAAGPPTGGAPSDPGSNPENPPGNGNGNGNGNDKEPGQDNGNHNGADNGNKGAGDAGPRDDNGKHNGADNGNKGGNDAEPGDNGKHNGADKGVKAGQTESGKGKGRPPAGQ